MAYELGHIIIDNSIDLIELIKVEYKPIKIKLMIL